MYEAIEAPVRQNHRSTTLVLKENPAKNQSTIPEGVNKYVLEAATFGHFLSPTYHASTSGWAISRVENNTPLFTKLTAKDIAYIRETTNISLTELAKICGVSRQAVHEWIKGSSLSEKNAQYISDLAKAVDILRESKVEISPQTLRRKVSGGISILDAVQESKAADLAMQLVDTLVRESEQRQRLASRLGSRQPIPFVELGAPHLNEKI